MNLENSDRALTLRTSARALVAVWQDAKQAITEGFAQIAAAEARLNAAYTLGDHGSMHVRSRYGRGDIDFTNPTDSLDHLARTCWAHIVDRLELRRVLSDSKWRELEKHLERDALPEITEETVLAFAAQYMTTLPELFKEKVTESFEWLRPREGTARAEYKANEKNAVYEIGEKIVLTSVVGSGYGDARFRVVEYAQSRLSALESVFRAMDGQGFGTKHYYSDIATAIGASTDGRFETEHFEGRVFKNGNLHLTFRRMDLLAEFNKIAGGAHLRAA